METNLNFGEGIDRVQQMIAAHDGMWPAVAFAFVALEQQAGIPPTLKLVGAHFQALPFPEATRSKLKVQVPLLVDGVLEMSQFMGLLWSWSRGEPGQIDHWTVPAPAGVNSVWWQADVPVAL